MGSPRRIIGSSKNIIEAHVDNRSTNLIISGTQFGARVLTTLDVVESSYRKYEKKVIFVNLLLQWASIVIRELPIVKHGLLIVNGELLYCFNVGF